MRAPYDHSTPVHSPTIRKVVRRLLRVMGLALITASEETGPVAKRHMRLVAHGNLQTALKRRRASHVAGRQYGTASNESAPLGCEAIVERDW
jgi:hypothetical protein